MEETWKAILGFERIYEVSSFGSIRSLDRHIKHPRHLGAVQLIKGRIIKFGVDKDGYFKVALWKNGKASHRRVHQLVAMAFLENPRNKPLVHHKDADVTNNSVDNLEWATEGENVRYAVQAARKGVPRNKGRHNPVFLCDKVGQFALDGTLIRVWPSIKEILRQYICERNIRRVIKGEKGYETAYGFIWKKVSRDTEITEQRDNIYCLPCYCFEVLPKRVAI